MAIITSPVKAFFSGEQLVIATQHQKERVLQPMLTQNLGVAAFVAPDFDTDRFGTFSSERTRLLPPLATARQKCMEACHHTGCRLAIASEGSFGAHPVFSFIPADEEVLLLTDLRHGLEFSSVHLSTRTNFAATRAASWAEAEAFVRKALFPSHGLLLRKNHEETSEIHKGITSWEKLEQSFYYFHKKYGTVAIETDMRALYNPTRMEVIGEAAQKLLETINCLCPRCGTPGFAISQHHPGLPCSWCGKPTRSIQQVTRHCQRCHLEQTEAWQEAKQTEDPQFCDFCNP